MAVSSEHPRSLPLVAALAVLFYLIAAADYLLTMLGVQAYLDLFTPEQVAYLTTLPQWVEATWAVGVWVGLLGALLLGIGRGSSPIYLAIGTIALGVVIIFLYGFRGAYWLTGIPGVALMGGGWLLALIFYLYARQMRAAGRLG